MKTIDRRHATWEREMKRLEVSTRLLAVVLLALVARLLISDVTATIAIAAVISAALTLASVLLTRYGNSHEPAPPDSTTSR